MHEQPAFNQKNQDPDWKKAVIVWNGNHPKRNEHVIFLQDWFSSSVVFIQFSSDTSCRAQNHQNVMQVMQILVKC